MSAYFAAKRRFDSVAKPLGSLGLLEDSIEKIAAVQHTADVDISDRCAVVMCADNGVTAEGVTQSDSSVTALCAAEIAQGRASINKLAETFGARVMAVDVGISRDVRADGLVNKKIAYGTKNIAVGEAMTNAQAQQAVCVGMDIMHGMLSQGVKIAVSGEMGIGNTVTAAAVTSVMLGLDPHITTGRGAGLSSEGLKRKIAVVERAIEVNSPFSGDPLETLRKVGGFDIAAMTGLFLGGAVYGIPVIIDGVISAAAAYLAYKISPRVLDYILPSHMSSEPSSRLLLEKMGLEPLITARLHLGEGTGGIMLLPLLDGALAVYNGAHRFDDIGLEGYVELK